MSLSTTFSEAVDLIRRNVYALLVIAAIVFVPTDVVTALIDDTRGWGDASFTRVGLLTLILVIVSPLAYAAAIAAIAVEPEGAEEEPRTPFAALRDAAVRWPTVLGIAVIGGVAVVAGLALLIVPGLVLFTWWFLAFQPAVIESKGWRASLGRSRELVRGSFWVMLLLVVIVAAGITLVDYVVYRIADAAVPGFVGGWVAGVVSDTVSMVVFAATTTAAYWELSGYRSATQADTPAESG